MRIRISVERSATTQISLPSLLLRSDFDTGIGALQGVFSTVVINFGMVTLQALLGPRLRFFRARHIDLLRALRCLGKNCYLVLEDLGESPRHRKRVRGTACLIGNRTDLQFGDERGVSGKNSEVPIQARNLRFFGRVLDYQPDGRDDLELESIGHIVVR